MSTGRSPSASGSQIQGFSGFGFPKAHSAAFGLLAYQSAWLRVHYGPEFLCALLNEQPMGFYPPDSLVHEAQRRGVGCAPPDANRSDVLCRVERVGVKGAGGPGRADRARLREGRCGGGDGGAGRRARARRRLPGVADLASRSGAGRDGLERLAWAGACGELAGGGPAPGATGDGSALAARDRPGLGRRPAGEQLSRCRWRCRTRPACPSRRPGSGSRPTTARPGSPWRSTRWRCCAAGSTPGPSPARRSSGSVTGAMVVVAGMVVARQRPATAKGIMFMLIEDETGVVNLIVPPPVYERHRPRSARRPWSRSRAGSSAARA